MKLIISIKKSLRMCIYLSYGTNIIRQGVFFWYNVGLMIQSKKIVYQDFSIVPVVTVSKNVRVHYLV